jgi:hypothetical protein
VHVTSYSFSSTTNHDYVTIKYSQPLPNKAPVIPVIGDKVVDEGKKLSFTVTATDDPTQTLTYSLEGTVPNGATINASTGQFEWTRHL